ncbi:MAG: YdeI/OmpD-associated family protein [Chloroflexota bacterium]
MSETPTNSIQPTDREAWRTWLVENHKSTAGIWLILYKKASGKQTFTFNEAVEEALCFGWIDSLPRKLDADRSMLYFALRKPGSGWSRVNKERIARMEAAGKMMPAGLAKINAAKADGTWTKLDAVENLEIPDDLSEAFDRYPSARENFEAFPRSVKRGILEWILNAKRPGTRSKRIEETASLAAKNERANQWPKKK